MVNRHYIHEVGLESHTPMLPRSASYAILALVGALVAFGVVRVASEAPDHAPAKTARAATS